MGRSVYSRLVAKLVLAPFLALSNVLVPAISSAQDLLPEPSLSLEGLERHFDRVDRAPDLTVWLEEADRGLAAVADWEREQARQLLSQRLAEQLARLLDERLAEEISAPGGDVIAYLGALDRSYLYQAAGGAVAVDSAGDPLLRGADGAPDDHAAWKSSIDARRRELVDAWALDARVAYDEILAQVPGSYRGAVSGELSVTLDEYLARAQVEFERLANQSEGRLLRGRFRDTYSLRRKSEGESAAALAAALVTSTEEALSRAQRVLRTPPGSPIVEPGDDNYAHFFQAGLDAWSQAEGRLAEERLAWEKASQETYLEAEAAWDAAFADLDQARTRWLASMRQILDSRRNAWDALERSYDEILSRSVSDLAAAAVEEQAKIRREVEAYRDSYAQALGLVALAEKNSAYLGNELESYRGAPEAEVAFLEGEKEYWDGLAESYRATAESISRTVAGLGAGYIDGFAGGTVDARAREVARLDRHIELLRHQRDIAQAVADYARDRSSGRATEAGTRERLAAAQRVYGEAEAAYLSQIGASEDITDELAGHQSLLAEAQNELLEATAEYQARKRAYDSLWLSWIAQDTTRLQRAVERLDVEVNAFYKTDLPTLYADYFEAAESSLRAEILEEAQTSVESLPEPFGDAYSEYPEGAPGRMADTRASVAAELGALLGRSEGDSGTVTFSALDSIATADEALSLFEALAATGQTPAYLSGVIRDYLALRIAPLGLNALPERPGLRAELDAATMALELADDYGGSLKAAAKLYLALGSFGPDGDPGRRAAEATVVEGVLVGELSAYIDRRSGELGNDAPEARARILAQGLEAVGLPPDLFGLDYVESFVSTSDLEAATGIMTRHYLRLSAEYHAIRDFAKTVERADELSEDPFRAENEAAVYPGLLARGLEVMGSETWDEGAGEMAAEAALASLTRRIQQHNQAVAERRQLRQALGLASNGRRVFSESAVQPAKRRLEEARATLAEKRRSYQRLIDGFDSLSLRYRESRDTRDDLYRDYLSAQRELQLAEELSDFAAHGYELESQSPEDVLVYRQAELDRVSRIGEIVSSLVVDSETGGPTDDVYQNYAAREASLRETKSYLLYVSEQLEKQTGAVGAELNRIRSEMAGAAYDLFHFPEGLYFDLDPGDLTADGIAVDALTRFDDGDPETFMSDVDAYFAFDPEEAASAHRAAQQFSADITRWTAGVGAHGGAGLLRDFGLAIHRERPRYRPQAPDTPEIPVEIEASQVYNAILDHRKIGNIDTQSVRNLINLRADEALDRIGANQETQALYTFFKAMFLSGRLSLDTSYISYDTSAIAREEARFRARKAYEFHNGRGKRMWRARLRRRIRHLYEDLPVYTGMGPRAVVAGTITSFASSLSNYHQAQNTFDTLSGASSGGVDESSIREGIVALEQSRSTTVPGASVASASGFQAARSRALDYIEGAMIALSESEKAGTLHAVQGLLSEVDRDLTAARDAMNRRLSVLSGAREADRAAYDYLVGAPELNESALREVAEALFAGPPFSPDSFFESQVAAAEEVTVFSPGGAAERMAYLAEALGQLGTFSVGLGVEDELQRLSIDRAELAGRRNSWEATVADLHRTASREFGGAFVRLAQERARWRDGFRSDYLERSDMWNRKHELLQSERQSWTEEATAVVVAETSARLVRQVGLSAESLIVGIEEIDIPALSFDTRSIDRVIARSLDDQLLTDLIDYADTLSSRTVGRRSAVAAGLPTVRSSFGVGALTLGVGADIIDEIHAKVATVAALQLRESLDRMTDRIVEQIADANQSVDRSFSTTLRSTGYTRSGSTYQRRAVIDESLLGGLERETHRIEAYRYFDAPRLSLTTDISAAGLSGLPGTLVEARIGEAQDEMQTYLVMIFGPSEKVRSGNGPGADGASLQELTKRLEEHLVTRLTVETERFAKSAQYRKYQDTEGLFNLHLGYAPVMDDRDPEKVETAGYGESGRIMEAFYRNEARLGRGLARMQTAWYDLRLYDDDKDNDGDSDRLIGAPTTRGVASIAASVAALATGNVWAAAMINLADDAAFGVADAASGRVSWEGAGALLGKQAAVGLASTVTGGVFSGFDNAPGFWSDGLAGSTVGDRVIGDTVFGSMALAGGEGFVNNNISGAVGALEWDGTGILGLGYNGTTWADNVAGRDALAGYASPVAQAGTTAYLTNRWSIEDHGFAVSENGRRLDSGAASQFAGAVVGESLTAGLAEAATLSVSNFSGIARTLGWEAFYDEESGTWARHGLAELSIGPMGAQVQLGGEGLDVSASNWRRVAAATRDVRQIKSIQDDLDLAAIQRDYLRQITDRAIGAEEALFAGTSSEAENLLGQLASIRRDQSRGNVYTMFNARRDDFSEMELDESLAVSMVQGDLSVQEFLHSTAFDTQGAFRIAAALERDGRLGLIDLFSSGKAYAGREYGGSETFDSRAALFGEYLRLTMRDDVINAEALLGGGVFHTASQIARRMLDDGDDLESVLNLAAGDVETAGGLHSDMVALKEAMSSGDGYGVDLSANSVRTGLGELLYRETIVNARPESITVGGVAGTPESAFPAMPDATYTSALGHRILTQSMIDAGVSGELYEFGLNKHDGGDYFSKDGRFVAVFEGKLSFLSWNDEKGLGIALETTDRNGRLHEFHYYHNSPDAVDRFALSILAAGGLTVPGGTVIGATGPDLTGIGTGDYGHLHAEYLIDGRARDPGSLGGQYRELSPYARHMSGFSPANQDPPRERYLDLDVLAGIQAYSRDAEPDYFRSYMMHHTGYPFGNVEEYLGYLDYLHQGGVRR